MKRKGICSVCACTEFDACDEGCGWANVKMTLCTACVNLTDAERAEKRATNLANLEMRLDALEEEKKELYFRWALLGESLPKQSRSKSRGKARG